MKQHLKTQSFHKKKNIKYVKSSDSTQKGKFFLLNGFKLFQKSLPDISKFEDKVRKRNTA